MLYAFTAAYEHAGKVVDFRGNIQLSVPLQTDAAFKLVRIDKAESEEGLQEIRTDIPFTFENNILQFETDTCGLFLLLPAE